MPEVDHATINRNLILIVPKQAALDWIRSVDSQPIEGLTLDELRQEQEVYLISPDIINTPEQAEQWALKRFSVLFASFLDSWFTNQALWPKRPNSKMFLDWLSVQTHTPIGEFL